MDPLAPQCSEFAAALYPRDRNVLTATKTAIAWDAAQGVIILTAPNIHWAQLVELHLKEYTSARLPYRWVAAIAAR